MRPFVVLTVCFFACQPPRAAGELDGNGEDPTDLDGVSRYLYRVHDAEDDATPIDALLRLEAWLDQFAGEGAGVTATTPYAARNWEVAPLAEDDLAGLVQRPDRPLASLKGAAVAHASPYPIACHVQVQAQSDQRPMESTASRYQRSFADPDAPRCFIAGECRATLTRNDVVRTTQIFEAEMVMWKRFRRLDYDRDGEQRHAFYSRGWTETPFDGNDGPGGYQLWQSYAVDVWIDRGVDLLRYQAVWTETDVYILGVMVDPQSAVATVASTTQGIFDTTDAHLRDTLANATGCAR